MESNAILFDESLTEFRCKRLPSRGQIVAKDQHAVCLIIHGNFVEFVCLQTDEHIIRFHSASGA
jgi:hypothetical protein